MTVGKYPKIEDYLVENSISQIGFLIQSKSNTYRKMQKQDLETYRYFYNNYSKWNIRFRGFHKIIITISKEYRMEIELNGLAVLGFPTIRGKERFCKKLIYRVIENALAKYMVDKI